MKNFKQTSLSILLFIFLFFSYTQAVLADNTSGGDSSQTQMEAFTSESGLASAHGAEHIVANVIKIVLSFLGIIFVILMIIGGFQWMTAGGNEDIVNQAQSRIKNAVIGLLIIVMAYGITHFIFKNLPGGVNNTTPSESSGT